MGAMSARELALAGLPRAGDDADVGGERGGAPELRRVAELRDDARAVSGPRPSIVVGSDPTSWSASLLPQNV